MDRGMHKDTVHVYIMKYYSTTKENKIMPCAAAWMDLEMLILSQSEKDKHLMTSLLPGT